MKEIIAGDITTTVDDEDYDTLMRHSWSPDGKGYIRRGVSDGDKQKMILMHRDIMGVTDPTIKVDHHNGNKLCNERWNLRICTNQQNCMNRPPKLGCSSKYKGVCWTKSKNKWKSSIMYDYKSNHIGYFDDEDVAALAYNDKAYKLYGEFAYLNIIQTKEPQS